jgi:hypothetical protein
MSRVVPVGEEAGLVIEVGWAVATWAAQAISSGPVKVCPALT